MKRALDTKTCQIYLHGQFLELVTYHDRESFFKRVSRLLRCPVEDVLVKDCDGFQYRNTIPRLVPNKSPLFVYNCPLRPVDQEENRHEYEVMVIVNGIMSPFRFDTEQEFLELLRDKLKLGDVREVALSRPTGKVYKLWDTSKVKDPERFLKYSHLFAYKKPN